MSMRVSQCEMSIFLMRAYFFRLTMFIVATEPDGVALERRALAPGHVVGAHPEAVARDAETDDAVQSAGRVLLEAPRAAAQRRQTSGGRGGGDPGRSPDHPAPHRPRHHAVLFDGVNKTGAAPPSR